MVKCPSVSEFVVSFELSFLIKTPSIPLLFKITVPDIIISFCCCPLAMFRIANRKNKVNQNFIPTFKLNCGKSISISCQIIIKGMVKIC